MTIKPSNHLTLEEARATCRLLGLSSIAIERYGYFVIHRSRVMLVGPSGITREEFDRGIRRLIEEGWADD